MEDYKDWLNKPCPKCGMNLLTQEDYDNVMMLMSLINSMNEVLPQRDDNEPNVVASIEMDGKGLSILSLKKKIMRYKIRKGYKMEIKYF